MYYHGPFLYCKMLNYCTLLNAFMSLQIYTPHTLTVSRLSS